MSSTIATSVDQSVTFGSDGYTSPLTITTAGTINGSAALAALYIPNIGKVANAGAILGATGSVQGTIGLAGADGIYVSANARIINTGSIAAGEGATGKPGANGTIQSGDGGIGVDLTAGSLDNQGSIFGGAGGSGFSAGSNYNGFGGAGASIGAGAKLLNLGSVTGGTGANAKSGIFTIGGKGGDGVDIGAGGALHNRGVITGGAAGLYSAGGYGVSDTSGLLENSGTIHGVRGGVSISGVGARGVNSGQILTNALGGYGVFVYNNAVFQNTGTITGGIARGGVIISDATLINHGLIQAGINYPDYNQEIYGNAVIFGRDGGGRLVNAGTIIGGTAATTHGSQYGILGGFGVIGYAGFRNSGQIIGGAGGFGDKGGCGVADVSGNVTNSGTITGGNGGLAYANYYYAPNVGGQGGIGFRGQQSSIILYNTGTVIGGNGGYGATHQGGIGGLGAGSASIINHGVIIGGNGGGGGNNAAHPRGTGGAGAIGATADYLLNRGVIIGGSGGAGKYGGNGGYGVDLSGTLVNAGTISGGAGGIGSKTDGAAGEAVHLGAASILIVERGAVFNGQVAATAGSDTLELAGKSPSPLTGIGTQFTGFATIAFADAAAWTISGTSAGLATGEAITGFTASDAITLTDAAASGTASVVTAGTVSIDAGGVTYALDIAGATVGETNFSFADHTLTETSGAMTFLAPAQAPATATRDFAALFASPAHISDIPRAQRPAAVTFSGASLVGTQDLFRLQQNAILPAVTFQV